MNRIPSHLRKLLYSFLLGMVIFSVFRFILFAIEAPNSDIPLATAEVLTAFAIGLQFDMVVICMLLALPLIVSTVGYLYAPLTTFARRFSFLWLGITMSITFVVSALDIPYFGQFFSRFSMAAFKWMDSPEFIFKMIINHPANWVLIIILIGIIALFIRLLRSIFKAENTSVGRQHFLAKVGFTLIAIALLAVGARGRLAAKSTLKSGSSYFCNNAFLNQLGLNPNFTLVKSYEQSTKDGNQKIDLMNPELALEITRKELGITSVDSTSPLARKRTYATPRHNYNVMIVLMESLSSYHAGPQNGKPTLTPFLDSLITQGAYFSNAHSAGIHTYNGIFSTLYSMPTLREQHPLKEIPIRKYRGIRDALAPYDYSSVFLVTHDAQFDNMEGFLRGNYFDDIISSEDYPPEVEQTIVGVPDDYMFKYSIPVLNELAEKQKPFLATYMTGSNHMPYHVPNYFSPRSNDISDQIIEYADYSMQEFITKAQKQAWYDSTLFVFVADHGIRKSGTYTLPLSTTHVPLLFFCPTLIDSPFVSSKMASQIDIFPSIMGLLRAPYTNTTLGVDLFRENRRYAYFYGEYKYGVKDSVDYMISSEVEWQKLYKYRTLSLDDYSKIDTAKHEDMDTYAKSQMQTFQYILDHNLQ